MTRTSWSFLFLAAAGLCLSPAVSQAGMITSAETGPAGATYTTVDNEVTLNAYSSVDPLTAGAFSTGNFVGVDGGNNANAVDDVDGSIATGADKEAIDMLFAPTSGLASITVQFSRADGPDPTDGIQISGFASDPGAVGNDFAISYDSGSQSLFAQISFMNGTFFNSMHTLTFGNLSASLGETLRLTVNDSTQGGPQAAINNITYTTIPEPGTFALVLLSGLAGLAFTRRR